MQGSFFMNSATALLQLSEPTNFLELLDAAHSRQSAARDLLRLLANAEDLGCPSPALLTGALGGVQLLVDDASQLYDRAIAAHRP